MDISVYSKLDEMKVMAGGNPGKMAEYATRKNELAQLKAAHFSEDFPFANSFSAEHLEELKKFAEESPEDESAQVRYALQKERFAVKEAGKTAHIDSRVLQSSLKQRLAAGESFSKADLVAAEKLARQNGTPDNLVLYSKIKQSINEGAGE